MRRLAKLALSDGTVFTGTAFGAEGEVFGEVVFNTSMTGYQEILTDPSYYGQIVTMSYPQIGNYGTNDEDCESGGIAARGFVIRELCELPSNFRSRRSLDEYLSEHGVVGIAEIDTRALVRRLRTHGVMTGILSTSNLDDTSLIEQARSSPGLDGSDYAREVMPSSSRDWSERLTALGQAMSWDRSESTGENEPLIVAVDYGMKWNIPRYLRDMNCRVRVVPGTATADDILALKPEGVFLSNGPGDPRPLAYACETIRGLLGQTPIFGICLGHQLLGLASGAEIFKLKFGHRGANQPVLDKRTGKVEITSQNHGFALSADSIPDDIEITHVNLNDGTVAGIRHKSQPAFGVQYHPEASAGPHDSHYLFREFRTMVTAGG